MHFNTLKVYLKTYWHIGLRWFDNESSSTANASSNLNASTHNPYAIDWLRVIPFIALHLGCIGVVWAGISLTAVLVALALYALRMFAITGFYHRYFSHKAFRTSRAMQCVMAVIGACSIQRGPLWWAAHHRHHHAHSDTHDDAHSALQHGFLWSHMGWFLARQHFATRTALVPDLLKFPELRFLDRYDVLMPLFLAFGLYGMGEYLALHHAHLATSGWQLVVWGFCISTVLVYQATFCINSLSHRFGTRRYATADASRNNVWLAILTLGEGWHNNHHHFPGSARQGFYWWEIDLTYYALRGLAGLGLIWDLRSVPPSLLTARRVKTTDFAQ
jgi:stearoyl-CoA desaturase (Delta-9 desaturase)